MLVLFLVVGFEWGFLVLVEMMGGRMMDPCR